MAAYVKFFDFVEQLVKAVHNFDAAGHVFKVYLSNATPDQTADTVKADLAEITAQNGYPSGGTDVQNTVSETTGTATIGATDVVFTGTTTDPAFGPFRYVVLYNDTATNDNLVAYWDYGSSISINNGETFTIDFSSLFTLS